VTHSPPFRPDPRCDHRPYPPPAGRWALQMRWESLVFLHWPLEPDRLRPHLPPGLELDCFEGRAYVGVVPFLMDRTRFRGLPPLPTAHRFPELNVRTYVLRGGRPGVWFFSLDAASRLAVRGARLGFHLPYFRARLRIGADGPWTTYSGERVHRGAPPAAFAGRYRATGPVQPAAPGSLEHFLTERYCLFARGPRGLLRGEIHHGPWPLQPGIAELDNCRMTPWLAGDLRGPPPLVHLAERLDVHSWWPVRD
jgi:uncharacterized protein YqjF (DUF2071 family)